MRAPRDVEILIAIIAGQICGDRSADWAVGKAEAIVEEVLRRGDERDAEKPF